MADEMELPKPLERVRTGIAGLDTVLYGGFFRSGIYMVMGRPGTGKTTLGSQIAFHHVAEGGRALYVTLLTDSHDRMFGALQPMKFFDASVLLNKLAYVSAYQVLEAEKLPGLLRLLRDTIKEFGATLLVIDGVVTAEAMAQSEIDLKKFLHELQVLVELFRCTAVLLTGARSDDDAHYAERTMVDGLLQLSARAHGMRSVRNVEVLKLRGSDALLGTHVFTISNDGVAVFPRLESACGRTEVTPAATVALPSGDAGLDAVLGGGFAAEGVTAVLGPAGSGKTLLGLQFLAAGGRDAEPGLYFGLNESVERVLRKAQALGIDELVQAGRVEVVWHPPVEPIADILCDALLRAVKARGVRRLFIDGLEGLIDGLLDPGRTRSFLAALWNELRAQGVTTVVSRETADLLGSAPDAPADGYWGLFDGILLLRYGDRDPALPRTLVVRKQRALEHSAASHAYAIGDTGFEVAAPGRTRSPARPARQRPTRGPRPPRTPARKRPRRRR